MYCISCRQLIDTQQRSGLVACPGCGSVNIVANSPLSPNSAQTSALSDTPGNIAQVTQPQVIIGAISSTSSSQLDSEAKNGIQNKKRQLVITGAIGLVLLLIMLPAITFGLQQKKSSNLIKNAQTLTNNGQYKNAISELEIAKKLWILPSTKKQIDHFLDDDKQWANDAIQVETAKQLLEQGKFQEAQKNLQTIKNNYPQIKDVKVLNERAQSLQDVAIKTEQARKAAEIKAQADAMQAASRPKTKTSAPSAPNAVSTSKPVAAATYRTNFPIVIRGDATCVSQTQQALTLLQDKALDHYNNIVQYMGIIECAASGSGMYASENPPRYVVGDATRNAGTIWYAGTIAHDAGHSRLYHEYLASHPGQAVPTDVWTGQAAEVACLTAQADALQKIGATQSTIDYVNNVINTGYYNIPLAGRWW